MPQPRQAFFAPTAIPQSLPLEGRTPSSLPPGGFAVLNDTPVACQTRGPTRRETGAPISRRRQPPPTHCGASRRNGRDLIIAKNDQRTSPYPRCCQRQRRKRYKRSPEPTTSPAAPIPRDQHRQICTYPPRAKGSLNRRFEWFSLVTFFLQKKKVTRAGARNSPSRARRRNTCSPPGQRPPRASVSFVSDGPISSNSGRNGGKNAGRNCVSALPQRATVGCDFPHLLAGITFHHRCQPKGLCQHSFPLPLPATMAKIIRSAVSQAKK